MNITISDLLGHLTKAFAFGGSVGLVFSIFTIVMVKKLAKRTERYELTYMPMTLVESKLWKCAFIAYPLFVGFLFVIACAMMKFL